LRQWLFEERKRVLANLLRTDRQKGMGELFIAASGELAAKIAD
jgi:hypothetical protein